MIDLVIQKLSFNNPKGTSLEKAVKWIKNHRIPNSGITVHHKTKTVTPEVTGYIIESLYNAGEKELAFDLARWEASIQKPDGSFVAPGVEVPYTFDTAQVARGFLSVLDERPEFENNLRRACNYVLGQIREDGKVLSPSYDMWRLPDGNVLTDYSNLYCLPPLLEAGKKLGEKRYIEAVKKSMDYFRKFPGLTEFKPNLGTLSHMFGYMMEALVDLGEVELAKKGLREAEAIQREDGAVPAYPGVNWVCSPGLAQLGIAWAKLKNWGPAQKAHAYLEKIQNRSGGFYGGYGQAVGYFDKKEICWATKFFIDLSLLLRGKNG